MKASLCTQESLLRCVGSNCIPDLGILTRLLLETGLDIIPRCGLILETLNNILRPVNLLVY